MSSVTRGLAVFALACWLIVGFGALGMAMGSPGGINAVLGGGIPGVAMTVAAVIEYRVDRRRRD